MHARAALVTCTLPTHVFFEALELRHENDDRIRVVQRCGACGAERSGCYAKRLDAEGRTAWGPPGEWWWGPSS
jgi:hypothetical protein